jgi:hypothetical protein
MKGNITTKSGLRKPLAATVAAIGGAGLVVAAPAAALIAAPGAQAAPVVPAPQQFDIPGLDFFGSGGLSAALFDPIFDIAGMVPVLNIFVANGVDGTATNPNGGNAGLFFGNGGKGFDAATPGGNGGNGGNAGPGKSTGTHNGGTGSAHIVSFTVVQQPRCPSGTTKYETPAVPAKISWKVSGATGIALSVDDPERVGSYGSYGAEGTLEFTFSCGGPVGSTETHTYTLTTTGGSGHPKSKTLTVSTKVLEKGTPV